MGQGLNISPRYGYVIHMYSVSSILLGSVAGRRIKLVEGVVCQNNLGPAGGETAVLCLAGRAQVLFGVVLYSQKHSQPEGREMLVENRVFLHLSIGADLTACGGMCSL